MSQAASIGIEIAKAFKDELKTARQLFTGGAVTGAAASVAGQALGPGAAGAVAAGGSIATGAVAAGSALASGSPAGAAVAGLTALAAAATSAASSAKSFAESAAGPGGGKAFGQVIEMFQASVGVTLLPLFIKLGSAVALAAEMLDEKFTGEAVAKAATTVQDWGAQIGKAATAIKTFTETVTDAIGKVAKWLTGRDDAPYVKNPRNDPHLKANEFGGGRPGEPGATLQGPPAPGPEVPKPAEAAPTPGPAAKPKADRGSPADLEARGLDMASTFIKDARAALGSQGQRVTTTNITDAWKKAQEAAGGSGFEKKITQMVDKHLALMEQQVQTSRKQVQKPDVVVRGN